MEIIQYKVIKNNEVDAFTASVEMAISSGWKLQGGISCSIDECGLNYYYQAIVK